jgi:hypothetical protein
VTNTEAGGVFKNVIAQIITGFPSQYIKIYPEKISEIKFNESGEFKVIVSAPAYMEEKLYNLTFKVKGSIIKGNVSSALDEGLSVSLVIYEIGPEEGNVSLSSAHEKVEELKQKGFPTTNIRKLLEKARKAFNDKKYKDVKTISEEISRQIDAAYKTKALMDEVKNKIDAALTQGMDVSRTQDLLDLAQAAFDREAYDVSQKHLEDALSIYAVETKSEFNVWVFAANYWWAISGVIFALIVSVIVARRATTIKRIDQEIEALMAEEIKINNLVKELQEDFFKRGAVTEKDYHHAMFIYKTRLTEIKENIARLRAKRAGILTLGKELDTLKAENERILKLMKEAQEDYFIKQTISWGTYESKIEEYTLRRIEIEENIAVLEAKLAKEKVISKKEKEERAEKERAVLEKELKHIGELIDNLERKVEEGKITRARFVKEKVKLQKREEHIKQKIVDLKEKVE